MMKLRPKQYQAEYVIEVFSSRPKVSTARSENWDVSIEIPGSQPYGKKYKVIVEEMEDQKAA